jgi:hypothetical protein
VTSNKNPSKNAPKTFPRKLQEKIQKITKKEKREEHNQYLRNHAESSIHTKEVRTRFSLPPDHPSLSKDLTMKLSPSPGNPKENRRREITKRNEIGFQELAAILSPLGLYGGKPKV